MNRFHRWYCRSDRWAATLQDRLMPWVLHGVDLGDDVLEVGPGPGLTTDRMARVVPRLTAIEVDPALADALRRRGTPNVEVVTGDATDLPFLDERFSGAVSFTMLHHVPSVQLQDRLLAQVHRVLRPDGVFAGSDSTPSALFRLAHLRDTMVVVDPDTFPARLQAAGFRDVQVRVADGAFRFRCRR